MLSILKACNSVVVDCGCKLYMFFAVSVFFTAFMPLVVSLELFYNCQFVAFFCLLNVVGIGLLIYHVYESNFATYSKIVAILLYNALSY